MRRVTKKIVVFSCGLLITGFYCDFLIYYVVAAQCSWPYLASSGTEVRGFVLADTHLLGPRRGHWFDKMRREWQMYLGFQAIMSMHQPEVVFVLGDLFDSGEWSDDDQFRKYVKRFHALFHVTEGVKMYVVPGNHDIGYHKYGYRIEFDRFAELMESPPVQLLTIKGNHFVLINSMAMEGDGCSVCREAVEMIERISDKLKDNDSLNRTKYSQPLLLQHFPLHRTSDEICTEPDAAPPKLKRKKFRNKKDTISKEATDLLVLKFKPRAVFGGHTHHGCQIEHKYSNLNLTFTEYTVPSFSWRYRPDPEYMLVTISPDEYSVNKCGLPKETTIAGTAVIMLVLSFVISIKIRTLGPAVPRQVV